MRGEEPKNNKTRLSSQIVSPKSKLDVQSKSNYLQTSRLKMKIQRKSDAKLLIKTEKMR